MDAVVGEPLAPVERIDIHSHTMAMPVVDSAWSLRGVAGHVRYVNRQEKNALDSISPLLGRAEATRAALIPIRKSPAWWALAQDERLICPASRDASITVAISESLSIF
jgi:hypothetical protein